MTKFSFLILYLTISLLSSCSNSSRKQSASHLSSQNTHTSSLFDRLPLKTKGRFIVDKNGRRFKLKSINWYGASDELNIVLGLDKKPIHDIVRMIKDTGFNSVRLPFSNEMLRVTKKVDSKLLAANPGLIGKSPIQIFDEIVKELSRQDIAVILNNHTTKSQWCCSQNDGDGLWYNESFTTQQWINDWLMLVKKYRSNPHVVAVDLRNELRANNNLGISPQWGRGGENDWHDAAKRAGNAILKINSNLLIVVEGLNFAAHLKDVYHKPLVLSVPNRLVYSIHSYHFFKSSGELYDVSETQWGQDWGFVISRDRSFTAPLWVGEFGIGLKENVPVKQAKTWLNHLMCYLQKSDIDFSYWALNGSKLAHDAANTLGSNKDKPIYQNEPYGLLDRSWNFIADDWRLQDIKTYLMPTREGPGIGRRQAYAPCKVVFGGRGGGQFDHSQHSGKKIKYVAVRSGDVIDSLVVDYGNTRLIEGGKSGKKFVEAFLSEGEYITEVQVATKFYKSSQTVAGIRISTNKRSDVITAGDYKLGENGKVKGAENYTYKATGYKRIVAFRGRSGIYLDSLGAIVSVQN